MKKVILAFLILFIGLAVIGAWYWQKNNYSKEVLKFEILGNEEAKAGEEIEYVVKLKNNGKFRLENPELIFQSPSQSILEGSENQMTRQKIEDIYPGEERSYTYKVRLFGKEGQIMKAKAWLDYKPKNLKTTYESETSFATRISSVPITFEFDLPSKVEKNSSLDFALNYFSNIDYPLSNLMVKITYPNGFSFKQSVPSSIDNQQWVLPSLVRASGGRIRIKGTLNGKEGEGKTFSAELGMIKDSQFWPLKDTSQTVVISEPSIYLSLLVNGVEKYVASTGEVLHYELFFKNIGNKVIQKKFIIAKLNSSFFDLSSLKSEKGEFGQGDNTIIWDWKNVPSLRFLDVGQEGKVEFWVKVKDSAPDNFVRNPELDLAVSVAGVEKNYQVKLNSKVDFSQKVYREEEYFSNEGPIPPTVSQTTQYAVVWKVKNSWNRLKDAKIKMVLPENVVPSGRILPTDAKFTYDSQSKEIVWKIGDIDQWGGEATSSGRMFVFQINYTPDSSQRDSIQPLVNEAEFSAEDEWTGEIIKEKVPMVKTDLPDDETVSINQGIVR